MQWFLVWQVRQYNAVLVGQNHQQVERPFRVLARRRASQLYRDYRRSTLIEVGPIPVGK